MEGVSGAVDAWTRWEPREEGDLGAGTAGWERNWGIRVGLGLGTLVGWAGDVDEWAGLGSGDFAWPWV